MIFRATVETDVTMSDEMYERFEAELVVRLREAMAAYFNAEEDVILHGWDGASAASRELLRSAGWDEPRRGWIASTAGLARHEP